MKGYVPPQSVREKEAANNAFVYDVESSCIVKIAEIWVSLSYTREKNEFSWQISHCIQLCTFCFKALSRRLTDQRALSPAGFIHTTKKRKIIDYSFAQLKNIITVIAISDQFVLGWFCCLGFGFLAGCGVKGLEKGSTLVPTN